MEILPSPDQFNFAFGIERCNEGVGSDALRKRLEAELRAAKGRLEVGEVVVPAGLLPAVARACEAQAESEPCGLRGATLYLSIQEHGHHGRSPQHIRPLATLHFDPYTVSTFELHLTLHHAAPAWTQILPHFLKNLAGSSTMVISPEFTLTKKKLYRTYQQE